MEDEVEITIVVENNVHKKGLLAEHGLAFWVDYKDKSYLFDTGQGDILAHNLNNLELKISNLSGVLLSHGHYDHAGGLETILKKRPEISVYGHPDIFTPKYSKKTSGNVFRGFSLTKDRIDNFIPVTDLTELAPGLFLTGEIPSQNKQEKLNDHYQVKEGKSYKTDPFYDDQSLVLDTEEGLVIVLGCSHAGVINILTYIKSEFDKKIHTIIGGMHLVNASESRIEWTVNRLAEIGFERLIPIHCTGEEAVREMSAAFEDKVEIKSVGDRIKL